MVSAKTKKGRNSWAQDAHSVPMEELHSCGRVHYRNKRYQAAVTCFTQAINGGIEDVISVLDNRSAAQFKLGNLQAALVDGQKMIKQDRTNVTGYLRAGKVLTLMGKFGTAKKLYEMGIGKVQDTDPYFPLLKKVHAKLVKQLGPMDPFQTLPPEVARMILSYLEFPDICRCTIVSKSWLGLLESISTLWTDLNFIAVNKLKKPVRLGPIREYIKRGNGLPTRVIMPTSGIIADNVARFIMTRCKGLYELVIPEGMVGITMLKAAPCATNLKTLIVGTQCRITGDIAHQLLEDCKALERAEFHNILVVRSRPAPWNADLFKIRSLTLIFQKPETSDLHLQIIDLEKLIKRIPNIRRLTLRSTRFLPLGIVGQGPDFSGLDQLESLDVIGMIARLAPKFPPSLHSLDISDIDCPAPDIVPSHFTKLVRLSFANARQIVINTKMMLEANKGKLTHLNATGRLSGRELEELIVSGYLESVEELKLGTCGVTDDQAISLANHAPNIKILYLENANITGVGVKALVTALKGKLEFLCLDECQKCSQDANTWAISMGVKTSFKFPDQRRGGRKLRP